MARVCQRLSLQLAPDRVLLNLEVRLRPGFEHAIRVQDDAMGVVFVRAEPRAPVDGRPPDASPSDHV